MISIVHGHCLTTVVKVPTGGDDVMPQYIGFGRQKVMFSVKTKYGGSPFIVRIESVLKPFELKGAFQTTILFTI